MDDFILFLSTCIGKFTRMKRVKLVSPVSIVAITSVISKFGHSDASRMFDGLVLIIWTNLEAAVQLLIETIAMAGRCSPLSW